jgi:cysteine desulfurase/selenocysteine lyase
MPLSIMKLFFTKGTTDGINLLAYTLGKSQIQPGDEIIISGMEHHSNIVPWQMVCEQYGAVLKVIPLEEDGTIKLKISKLYFLQKQN